MNIGGIGQAVFFEGFLHDCGGKDVIMASEIGAAVEASIPQVPLTSGDSFSGNHQN